MLILYQPRKLCCPKIKIRFSKRTCFGNFETLEAISSLIQRHIPTKTKSNLNAESITDMMEFQKLSGNALKHVTLVGELSKRVQQDCLLEVSELEQSLVCSDSHAANLNVIHPPKVMLTYQNV